MNKMSNAAALQLWNKYRNNRVPMIIRPTPKDFDSPGAFVVVPAEDRDFVMSDFSSIKRAEAWCAQNGHAVKPDSEIPAQKQSRTVPNSDIATTAVEPAGPKIKARGPG
jgi:hypothetical protein